MTQSEFIGFGEISKLCPVLSTHRARRVCLVTGRESFRKCGAEVELETALEGFDVSRFSDFSQNPKLEDILTGLDQCSAFAPDTIVAVGGGTAIDVAKGIRFLGTHTVELGGKVVGNAVPGNHRSVLVAVPTTAGSGSESTHFAVVYVDGKKHSLADASILPDIAIVDPTFTMSLSPYQTAVSGMDAFCQAVESYWSIHSTETSKYLARQAIELVVENLPEAVNTPSAESRLHMAQAAHLAGKAINITKTTAPHAISYPLTSFYGIPHGQAVAVSISSLLAFNYNVTNDDVLDRRGADYVKETISEICGMLGAKDIEHARERVDSLIKRVGLAMRLRELGVESSEDVEGILEHAFSPDRVGNNPRLVTREGLRDMLLAILE